MSAGKGKTSPRRGERALAFQVLYGISFSPATTIGDLREAYWQTPDNAAQLEAALDMQAKEGRSGETLYPSGFAWELVEGVWRHCAELDVIIGRHSRKWRVDRMGRIEAALLRLAVFEMLYRSDVPAKVAINEALELGKQFGDQNACGFINGILDSVVHELESSGNATHR